MFQSLGFHLQVTVAAQLFDQAVEVRARVPVHLRLEIGIGEDEVFGDVAEFDIVGEEREVGLLVARRHCKVRAAEKRAGHEEPEIAADLR
ncbi:hypothetical protein D3C71_1890430 [compost metagenome]